MLSSEPISLPFAIPASDHLAREAVQGQLRFHADHIDLHWRLKGNVFTGGPGEMNLIEIPYGVVAEVKLNRRWFRPPELVMRVEDPSLVAEIPGIEVGRLILQIDSDSKDAIKEVQSLIDFRRSLFLLDNTNKRLEAMRE